MCRFIRRLVESNDSQRAVLSDQKTTLRATSNVDIDVSRSRRSFVQWSGRWKRTRRCHDDTTPGTALAVSVIAPCPDFTVGAQGQSVSLATHDLGDSTEGLVLVQHGG